MFSQFSSKSHYGATPSHLDYRLVFAASCLLSVWLIAIDPILNRDAIIYLRTADAYLQGGILAGLSLFDRPLLPITFALLHKYTGIPLVYAGQIVVSLFYALLAISFVATVRVLGGDRRVQILAAIVIVSHPELNASRASIMRDPAYWALCMLAFRELLLFARCRARRHQVLWFVFIGLASLFRFEGLFFAALAPAAIFIASERGDRWKSTLQLAILPLIAMAMLVVAILVYQAYLFPGEQLFRDIGGYIRSFTLLPRQFELFATGPALNWLGPHSQEDANAAAISALAAILLLNIFRAIIWPYVGVLIWGATSKLSNRVHPRDRTLINAHLLICLLYLALFVLTKRFMLERYCSILTLFLLLYVPFILNGIWAKGKKYGGKFFVFILLLGFSVDSLTNGDHEKAYVDEATEWILANTPEDASLVSNSTYIAYFSKRNYAWSNRAYQFRVTDLTNNAKPWRDSDYLAILVKRSESAQWQAFLANNSLQELKVFRGNRHGDVSIVEVPKPELE